MNEIVVLVTAGSQDEAQRLSRLLVKEHLVACVNIVPQVTSIFLWEEKISEETECLLIMKTVVDAFPSLEARVKAIHHYDVPEILALPVVKGSGDYVSWIRKCTQAEKPQHARSVSATSEDFS